MSKGSPIAPFDNRQRRAILVFFMVCCLSAVAVWLFNYFYDKTKTPYNINYARLNELEDSLSRLQSGDQSTLATEIKYHLFDPNTEDSVGLRQLGFSPKQARQLINFRNKGGLFRSCEDLLKLYAMTPDLYASIEPYCHIKSGENLTKTNRGLGSSQSNELKDISAIDLNLADSAVLEQVPSIGPASIERFLKYRQRLGGIIDTTQLKEIMGLQSDQISQLKKYGFISSDYEPRKIYINRTTEAELRQHPYLSFKQIRLLLAYRKQHGPFRSMEELSKTIAFSDLELERLKPYLSFEY